MFTRAGKAYSWGKGKGNVGGSTALREEYSSLPLDAMAVTQKGVVGGEAADAGGGPSLVHPWRRSAASGHEKVGFMDRLGLVSLIDTVSIRGLNYFKCIPGLQIIAPLPTRKASK